MLRTIHFHWAIENSLHWILDMSFNEDYLRIRKGNAPQIMAIIRHMALNLLQSGCEKGHSIKGLRKICAWNENILDNILSARQKTYLELAQKNEITLPALKAHNPELAQEAHDFMQRQMRHKSRDMER